MERLTWMLAGLLGHVARLLPPGRRQWAEAVRAEAGQVPRGWPRLSWVAGGVWLVAREAAMMRRAGYWLGAVAVAAAAAWAVWLSWQASPAADPQAVTDRVRVLVAAAALVVLPWVGRRRGWFGPAGRGLTARLVRVAGGAAVCGLGVAVVRMDSHLGRGPHQPGPFSMPREIIALVLLGVALAVLAAVRPRWRDADPAARWLLAGIAVLLVLVAVPVQGVLILYVAGILAATSRQSPVTGASLAAGTITGMAAALTGALAAALATGALVSSADRYMSLLYLGAVTTLLLLGGLAGAAGARLLPDTGDPHHARVARGRQGVLAGAVAGAVCGLLLADFTVTAMAMMVVGPLAGAASGAIGGVVAADHPRTPRPARSWAAGVFVRF